MIRRAYLGCSKRVAQYRQDVGRQIEQHIGCREDERAGLHDRDVAFGHRIDHQLAQARIDEDDLHDHHPDHQIGQVQHDHVDDGRQRVGQGVMGDDASALNALEIGHLDIGAGQKVDDRGPGHAHHVRDHHQGEGQGGQDGPIDPFPEFEVAADIRDAGEHAEVDREHQDQDIGDEEFGKRDRGQGKDVDRAVVKAVAVKRRQNAQGKGQRNRDGGSQGGEKQGVEQPAADQFGDLALIGERAPEVALNDAEQPIEVTLVRRQVELQLAPKRGHGFRRGRLAQDRLRQIAGQKLHRRENDERNDKEREDAQRQALGNHL